METYTKKNCDSHIILYAKNHYKITDTISDLKRIYSLRNAIDVEHIHKKDILRCLINLVEKLRADEFEMHFSLLGFLSDIDPNNNYFWRNHQIKSYDFDEACIRKCLSLIQCVKVFDGEKELLPLDKPNENVLPLRE